MRRGHGAVIVPNDVSERRLRFRAGILAGWDWPVWDVRGGTAGPALAVMAGVHVNELAGIEAIFRLREAFRERPLRGSVSLMPVVNLPAWRDRSQHVCPLDGRNINFSFPGNAAGSFSEALADALLDEWADDADCLVDLHGGDLCEAMAPFTIAQGTGDVAFDDVNLALAHAFAPCAVVRLGPEALARPGRSCSGRARRRQHAAFAEAGSNGLLDEASIRFHVDGVLRVAGLLGMIDDAPAPGPRAAADCAGYRWIAAEAEGWCRYHAEPGARITAGGPLATIADFGGREVARILAPEDGIVLWRCTHAAVMPGSDLFGLGTGAS